LINVFTYFVDHMYVALNSVTVCYIGDRQHLRLAVEFKISNTVGGNDAEF